MLIKIIPNDKDSPAGKLADAELHFTSGLFEGLKLIGFGVWEAATGKRRVTFPARQYSINGERRSFALLRPNATVTFDAQERLTACILQAYAECKFSGGIMVLSDTALFLNTLVVPDAPVASCARPRQIELEEPA